MKKRYEELMDSIQVTDEMRSRILQNLQKADLKPAPRQKVIPFSSVRKYLSLAACFAVLLFGALALSTWSKHPAPNDPGTVFHGSGIEEVSSAEELSAAVGYEVRDITGLPFDVLQQTYTAYWGELAEIHYIGAERTAVFRKSPGNEDNSGDYTVYAAVQELPAGTIPVTLKGDSQQFTLAVWHDGAYSYSLNLSDGLTAPEWAALITDINQ